MISRMIRAGAMALAAVLFAGAAQAQEAPKGKWEKIVVHGPSLAGNLEGDSADRDVFVYLPPSYGKDRNRRYPVVYKLHGYTLTAERWTGMLKWPGALDNGFATSDNKEFIIVAPDAMSLHAGSMYSNSVTTGDWEGFIAKDLVAYIDSHYRTIADRRSRGLTGHSMGGYGTFRIGMKHPEVFSAIYAMSSCCMPARTAAGDMKAVEAVKTKEDATKGGFGIRSTFSVAAAWSPNPNKPPLYVDLPTKDGVVQPDVIARWAANAPLVMVHQYIPAMRRMTVGFEIGTKDGGLQDSVEMDRILTDYKVPHTFETYDGDHTNRIAERFESNVLPFFSKALSFEAPKKGR